MTTKPEKILVIRLGALGDIVFCFQAFHEIRRAHPEAEIALLTRKPFAAFAGSLPWFDRVILEKHPTVTRPSGWMELRREVQSFAPTRVYDLQGKMRQTILYGLLGGPFGPEWSGAAPLCKFPRLWPPEPGMHFRDFLAAQLRRAGVPACKSPDLGFLDAPTEKFALPVPYVLIIPGCSPGAPHKRWPPQHYAQLAQKLHAQGLAVAAVGTGADKDAVAAIKALEPNLIDLCGQTNLYELAGLFRRAAAVVGNDTGPMHLAAAVGAPTLALFSGRTKASWSAPRGTSAIWRQAVVLDNLAVDTVFAALQGLLQHSEKSGATVI